MSFVTHQSRYRGPAAPVNPPPAGPAWLLAITVGQWGTLPSSTFSTSGVGWSGTSPGGSDTWLDNFKIWSSADIATQGVVDYLGATHTGSYFVFHGGGHSNWYGDDVYAYGPFENDTPSCLRLKDPAVPPPLYPSARDGSGNPVACHPYGGWLYLPIQNKMIRMVAPGTSSGGNDLLSSDLLSMSAGSWSSNDTGAVTSVGSAGVLNITGAYNSVTGYAWGLLKGNTTKLLRFNDNTGAWVNSASGGGYNINNPNNVSNTGADIDTIHNLLCFQGTGGALYATDLNSPGTDPAAVTTSGSSLPTTGDFNLAWDITNGCFYSWNGSGTPLYKIMPPATLPFSNAWAVSILSGSGGIIPPTEAGSGTFGRIRVYKLSGKVFIALLSDPTQPISVFRVS